MTRSKLRQWCLLVVMLVAAAASPATLAAQTMTGSISGTVVDAQGAVVPGATVTIVDEATSSPRVAVSDGRGDFQVTNLQAGRYTVRVEVASFRPYERKNVVVSSSERVAIGTIAIELGRLTDTVSVAASGTHVNTTETQHGGVITRTQIEQIQVLGRDVTSLMRLLPGVRYTVPVDSMGGSFGVDVPNVGGLPADWSKVIIDGVVGNEAGNSGMQAQMVNLDAIAEVRLLNNSYRAEYGQSGGSQLQIVTRGGTSAYRGSGYWYVRNEKLNSTEFFRARAQRLNGIEPFPPKYRFNTYGANLGGPVLKGRSKLFFFYSLEAPIVNRPQSVQNWRMPSALERKGDFSQTFDAQGRLINIKDPRKVGLACNAVTGGPGCFEGNIIPAALINPAHMQAMLNLMPLPEYDPRTTQGNYNYDSEEITENPKRNHVARVDWRPTSNDSLSFTFKDWKQDQRGTRIPAGPSNWQWFNAHYTNTDRGFTGNYSKVLRNNLVWDTDFGARTQTEVFFPLSEAEWDKTNRQLAGFTPTQFHPELNPRNVLPRVNFGTVTGGAPNFTYDTRLIDKGQGWLSSVRSNLTWVRGAHSIKTGMYYEDTRNSEGKGGVGGGSWSGDFNFGVDTSNPLDANYAYANALLGNINSYTETSGYADVRGQRPTAEAYVQDTWKPARNLTIDYGARFLWYRAWASFKNTKSASFDPDLYVAGGSPLLYQPALIGGQQRAVNPVTGEVRPYIYVGGFVPGTGNLYNGMVTQDEWGNYGTGFRQSQGVEPEGRAGLAWDITGSGKTSLHASLGRYHNPFVNANGLDNLARNPPAQSNPILRYSTIDQMLTPEGAAAFDTRPSGGVLGLQHDAPTPKSLNFSIGVQREVGWGTVLDVTYAGSRTRNIEVSYNINDLPYATNFIDVNPQNINPATGTVLPADFLRPYRGFGTIAIRQNTGKTDYNSMQVQLNRRYVKGLQFALAYTLAKGWDTRVTSRYRTEDWFNRAPTAGTQLHNLTISYTWDVPHGSRLWDHRLTRAALDGWQLSGNTAFVSGDWAGVTFSTTDNFDFYGGGAGGRMVLTGADPRGGDNRDPNPDGTGSYLNWAAFARPSGRLDLGNAPQRFFRLPWIKNTDLSMFKNFAVGGRQLQVRWEIYNLFNTVNWSGIDTSAQFNPAGQQVDTQFGKATSARDPRIMQAALRFTF
ncbi:MAG: carboxypeptidase regulatory-like domain-containing protein [Vicinamibacterales bacterium]